VFSCYQSSPRTAAQRISARVERDHWHPAKARLQCNWLEDIGYSWYMSEAATVAKSLVAKLYL
jgi:hypothetical protein